MILNKCKIEKTIMIHSPISGEMIPLDHVPDPVFSRKVMGEGLAIIPINGEVFSPINGKVIQISPTKQSIGMVTEEGIEVLLHLGVDTGELNGEGFDIKVEPGEIIHVYDRMGTFDLSLIEERGKEIISVLVFPNFEEKDAEMILLLSDEVVAGTEIAQVIINA